MMIGDLGSGAAAGLAVAMPLGAVGAYLIGLGARERIAVATAAALGVASVDGGYAVIATLGGTGLRVVLNEVSGWLDCRRRSRRRRRWYHAAGDSALSGQQCPPPWWRRSQQRQGPLSDAGLFQLARHYGC
jgi:hypothetical protein